VLFKHKHLLEELRRHGLKARAEILSMTTLGAGGSGGMRTPDEDLTKTWTDCRMKLRVIPEDRAEAPFEAEVLTRIHTLKFKGAHVPVWYDPRDHSKVVVDYEEDAQNAMRSLATISEEARVGTGERLAHRYDQRLGLAWTPVGGHLLPLEVICRPGQGRLTAHEPLGAAASEAGETALAAVQELVRGGVGGDVRGRAGSAAFLPSLAPDWFATHDLYVLLSFGGLPDDVTSADWSGTCAAIAAAMVSLLGGHMVRTDVALTGMLAATGGLLPVDGLAQKTDAAVKGYVRHFVVPAANEREARAVPERRRKDLEFVYASTLGQALQAALSRHPVKGFEPPA
jgi:ATP-dependent Lon protease